MFLPHALKCICTWYLCVFIMSSNNDTCWRILQAINSHVCLKTPHLILFFTPRSLTLNLPYRSVLTKIEIVIDLPHLSPVNHKASLTRPIGNANTAGATGQSARSWDVQLAPCVFYCPLWWIEPILGIHLLQHIPPAHQWVGIVFLFQPSFDVFSTAPIWLQRVCW